MKHPSPQVSKVSAAVIALVLLACAAGIAVLYCHSVQQADVAVGTTAHIFSDCMITLSYLQSPRPGRDITGKNAVLAYYTISMRAMQAECQKAAGG